MDQPRAALSSVSPNVARSPGRSPAAKRHRRVVEGPRVATTVARSKFGGVSFAEPFQGFKVPAPAASAPAWGWGAGGWGAGGWQLVKERLPGDSPRLGSVLYRQLPPIS